MTISQQWELSSLISRLLHIFLCPCMTTASTKVGWECLGTKLCGSQQRKPLAQMNIIERNCPTKVSDETLMRAILSLPNSIYPCFCHWDCEYWEKHGNKVTIWWGISSFCFAVSSTFAFHSTSAVTSSAATCSVPLADHLSPSCDHHSLTRPLALVRSGVLEDDHKHNCMSKSISTLHFNRLAEQSIPVVIFGQSVASKVMWPWE